MIPLNRGRTFVEHKQQLQQQVQQQKRQMRQAQHAHSVSAKDVARHADNVARRLQCDLPVVRNVLRVNDDEIVRNNPLGEGGYCKVESVEWRGRTLAMKALKQKTINSPSQFRVGFKDLVTEATVLSGLDHDNIIKIHGVASGTSLDRINKTADGHGFFILVDQMDDTLDKKIISWQSEGTGLEEGKMTQSNIFSLFSGNQHPPHQVQPASWNVFVRERLPIAIEIAQGIAYLHKRGVMYRDLKPDNVGIVDGQAKLLDFGLATTEYQSRECAGSRRYMAPEVVLRKRYNKSVDVYSFGIILWYLCALKKPYETYSAQDHFDNVVIGGERPEIPTWWPKNLHRLLSRCWSLYPSERPDMEDVVKQLQRMTSEKPQAHQQTSKKVGKVVPIAVAAAAAS